MEIRPLIGVLGVLIAAAAAEFNDVLTALAIPDISGGLALSHDPSTWFNSLYVSAEALGMALSPWLLVTFTIRQFTLFVILLNAVSTLLIPFAPELPALYMLRLLQGLSGGFTIPLLMTGALRVLAPSIRIYGFAVYAASATFFPALCPPLAALWTGFVGWRFIFYEVIPLCALAAVLVWYGLPQDRPAYERFRIFDWRGALLILAGFGSLTTLLQQGDRLDWFNSPIICVLALTSAVTLPLLFVNEWFHDLPLLKFQLFGRPNLAYGGIALCSFIIISQSASTVPLTFLQQVAGYRPEQAYLITALIACAQPFLLPLSAFVMDFRRVDARIVHGLGLVLVMGANIGASFITTSWSRDQFYLWQGAQAIGQPMVVMSLLLLATNAVHGPDEAPFASALVNTPRALAEAVGVWLVQLIQRTRGALHYNRLADQLGQERFRLPSGGGVPPYHVPGTPELGQAVRIQAGILTLSDTYLIYAGLTAALLLVLILLAKRTLPPRILFAKQGQPGR